MSMVSDNPAQGPNPNPISDMGLLTEPKAAGRGATKEECGAICGSCCSVSPLPLLRTAFTEKHFTVKQNLHKMKGNKALKVFQSLGGWVLCAVEAALVCSLHGRAAGCLALLSRMGRSCAVCLGDCWALHSPSHIPVTWCTERTPRGQLISEGGQKPAAQT